MGADGGCDVRDEQCKFDQGRVVRNVSASVYGKGMLRSGYRLE